MGTRKILVVEDDESLRRVMQVQLEKAGHKTAVAADAGQALEVLNHEAQDVVITDLNLPGISGLELLKKVRTEHPETVTIVVTAYGTVTSAVDAMKAGAYDYVMKPVHSYELKVLVDRLIENKRLVEEVQGPEAVSTGNMGSKAMSVTHRLCSVSWNRLLAWHTLMPPSLSVEKRVPARKCWPELFTTTVA